MERLARLLPFRQFGRLRHLRNLAPCAPADVPPVSRSGSLFEHEESDARRMPSLPSALPAFARVSLNAALNTEPARRAPVRVYHGPSRVIMVGTVDAVCRMIDRCIAEERAELQGSAA
ncbi:MAG TPA: hypothetical protein VGL08_10245 [Paraburkholderia sp.]|jgi:hypothetical protein